MSIDWEKYKCTNCYFYDAHSRISQTGLCTYRHGCSLPFKFKDKKGIVYELDKNN